MTREEALNEIKSWDFLEGKEIEAIHTLIPELRKSEDERIRKLLVWQVYRNIEDETNDLAQSVYDGIKGHDPDIEESIEDWKKCLAYLEKQKEQKPVSISCGHENDAEWGQEDKEKIVTISEIIEHCTTIPYSGGTLTLNKEYKKELLCFIKSLRPSWKPSEEQMEALERASTNKYLSAKQFDILVSLHEDLNKL